MSPTDPGPGSNSTSSERPQTGNQASGPAIDLDLAFSSDDDLAEALLNQAGPLADPLAGADLWHERLSGWLDALQAELPEALQSEAYCLGLQLVSDASIAALNQDWRGKSGPTDVLAFAAQDDDLEGAFPMPLPPQLERDGEEDSEDDGAMRRTARRTSNGANPARCTLVSYTDALPNCFSSRSLPLRQ